MADKAKRSKGKHLDANVEYRIPKHGEMRDVVARAATAVATRVAKQAGKKPHEVFFSIGQVRQQVYSDWGVPKDSSFRSAMQNCEVTEPGERGMYRLKVAG